MSLWLLIAGQGIQFCLFCLLSRASFHPLGTYVYLLSGARPREVLWLGLRLAGSTRQHQSQSLIATNICPFQWPFMLYLLLLYHVLQQEIKSPAGYKALSPRDW